MSLAEPVYLSAREAAAELGVSTATLYAYVSRGLLRSETTGGRRRRYRADDVKALVERRAPDAGADGPSREAPILDSEITLIAGGGLYYRGRDALALAESASLEAIAALLWDCAARDPFAEPLPDGLRQVAAQQLAASAGLAPVPRAIALLAVAAESDSQAFAVVPESRARLGARILRLTAAALSGDISEVGPLHAALGRSWGLEAAAVDLVRMALVLSADHELNASTFTVRCVASTNANLYFAVAAGLAALSGPLHGGGVARVEAMLAEFDGEAADLAVARRLQRGDDFPGCGHRLYVEGDPRARRLLQAMRQRLGPDARLEQGLAVAEAVERLAGLAPNIDFALALLARVVGRADDGALVLFALGRTVGWIAHAMEQYRARRLIRPRARYTGIAPGPG